MSDEEKKAIESLKNIAIYIGDNYTFSQQGIRNLRENLRIVLPVIEKQSKEIELLKEENEKYKNPPFFDEDKYTENDKIKAKIKEVHYKMVGHPDLRMAVEQTLQSLLEKE